MKRIILFFIMTLMAVSAFGDSFYTPAIYGYSNDSITVYRYNNGAIADSARRTSTGVYDTTWTVTPGTQTMIVYISWPTGADSTERIAWSFLYDDDPTPAEIYAEFISGSNEDAFKATGFSTFNPASDSVIVDGSALAATANAISATTIATDAITAAKIAANAIGASELAANCITASEIADDAIDYATFAATQPTGWWNVGKTGYSLTQAFPSNFSDLNIKVTSGEVIVDLDNSTGTLSDAQIDDITVTAGTVSDKTGYSLSTAGIDAILEYDTALISGGFGEMVKDTLVYQGSVSGLDSVTVAGACEQAIIDNTADTASIARSVWDNDIVAQANRDVGDVSGNVTGSVGSVTGAVGSVTGAVGSVTAGVTVTTNNDKTGYSLLASQWEEAWMNIDTTHIDSSGLGVWFVNNLAGSGSVDYGRIYDTCAKAIYDSTTALADFVDAVWDEDSTGHYTSPQMAFVASQTGAGVAITDADMGAIADSVWDKIWADVISVSGGAGDEIKDRLDAMRDSLQYLVTATGFATTSDSVLLANRAEIAKQISDSILNDADSYKATGFVTTSDSVLIANRAEISKQISDSVLNDADSYKANVAGLASQTSVTAIRDSLQYLITATGFSTHSAADIWAVGTRTLTALGFNMDSTDFADSAFAVKLFATDFWAEIATRADSGSASAITDANMGAIADSVWQALANQYTAVPGSFGDVIYDSLDALVSSAGGVAAIADADMKAIIDSLFNRVAADTVSGSYLAELLRVAASGTGTGAYTRTVLVLDTVGTDSPIADASVFFNNTAQSVTPYSTVTDNNGLAYFNVDSADWVILMNEVGYKSILDTVTVSATGIDTIMTYSTFPTTTSPNMATVTGTLLDAHGNPYDSAECRFLLKAYPDSLSLTYDGALIIQRLVYDTTNASGEFSVSIYPNDSLSDSSYYYVEFYDSDGKRIVRESKWNIYVPNSAVLEYNNLTKWK